MERFHQQQQKEDSSSPPSTVSDHDDTYLDFLGEHFKAVEERLKSATGLHKTSLQAERDRTITMIQFIAALKRKNDAAANPPSFPQHIFLILVCQGAKHSYV
jgi:hypothetical protein